MPQQAGWVNVPGKGERWRNADGSYQYASPNSGLMQMGQLFNRMISGGTAASGGIWSAPARAAGSSFSVGSERQGPYLPANLPNRGGPGQGAPAPVVAPASRARAEALNTASQQAGGPNLSKPLVPTEAQAASKEYATTRENSPLAAVPELIDQRSQAYEQRADIQAWAKANPQLAARLFAKQRNAGPSAMQADAAGLRGAYGGDLNVGPGAKALEEVPYQGGISPAGAEQLKGAYSTQLPPGTGGSLEGLAYQGPAPMTQPQAMQQGAQGLSAAFGGELSVAPQASAQQSNLNGPESPLVQATTSQSLQDQQKAYQMQAGSDLLAKYRLKAGELNSYWRG